ncbi:phosphotransferase family enzyme [Herbihabitans rhizosphaerae]|uniref:Phosphotransferase family enzyme n=1 Tax=Herbihabitans rhizosphaerae TaxID=1872711 RepID=A0A4V2ERU1_9PSEU|nr:phosphotransferase [Herbihabitans rhizosphaerae]RZS34047.1 phosphotransferase family enzyme [Herbihabitans rhizosphaerae]
MSSAVDAAIGLARSLGVRAGEPEVLSDGANVIVHLRPAPVVARVATLTALIRPGVAAWLGRDIALAEFLAAQGVPVVTPSADLPPGPHERDGFAISFFTYVEHDDVTPSPATVGAMLGELHAALRSYPGELPSGGPFDDTEQSVVFLAASGAITGEQAELFRAEADRLRGALAGVPVQPLHGDAHPGNLIASRKGLLWNDFEDTWRGPAAWDHACLANTRRLDGWAALEALPSPPDAEALDACLALRRLFGVLWRLVFADRFPHRRAEAEAHLASWLDQRSASRAARSRRSR